MGVLLDAQRWKRLSKQAFLMQRTLCAELRQAESISHGHGHQVNGGEIT
jgi:hypothetical protein